MVIEELKLIIGDQILNKEEYVKEKKKVEEDQTAYTLSSVNYPKPLPFLLFFLLLHSSLPLTVIWSLSRSLPLSTPSLKKKEMFRYNYIRTTMFSVFLIFVFKIFIKKKWKQGFVVFKFSLILGNILKKLTPNIFLSSIFCF